LAELFGDFPDRLRGNRWQPALDVFETEDSVAVRIEIPGVRGEDIRVNVDADVLRISGIRRVPESARIKRLHQMEIAFGSFEREVRISIAFDRAGVNAHLEDGFLLITLPKMPPPERKEVVVETE
jgi:HSP20 family protein